MNWAGSCIQKYIEKGAEIGWKSIAMAANVLEYRESLLLPIISYSMKVVTESKVSSLPSN